MKPMRPVHADDVTETHRREPVDWVVNVAMGVVVFVGYVVRDPIGFWPDIAGTAVVLALVGLTGELVKRRRRAARDRHAASRGGRTPRDT